MGDRVGRRYSIRRFAAQPRPDGQIEILRPARSEYPLRTHRCGDCALIVARFGAMLGNRLSLSAAGLVRDVHPTNISTVRVRRCLSYATIATTMSPYVL